MRQYCTVFEQLRPTLNIFQYLLTCICDSTNIADIEIILNRWRWQDMTTQIIFADENITLTYDCRSSDDIDGHTFVVTVKLSLTVGENEETASFDVNCQFDSDDGYFVDCSKSGGDYYGSGLAGWMKNHDLDMVSGILCSDINLCAQAQSNLKRQAIESKSTKNERG